MDDDFKELGTQVLEWMNEYRRHVHEYPVRAQVSPGQVRSALPRTPPDCAEPFASVMRDLDETIVPGMTHWNHPRFFAYFSANNSVPSILAEMITAAIGAQCMSWETSPAATELEQVVLDWLRQMLDLPATFRGVIQDTASSATMVALLMARERSTDGRFAKEGAASLKGGPLRVYASAEAHSSVEKGACLTGFGRDNLVPIPTDERFALRADALDRAIQTDAGNGLQPSAVVATVGTTGSTANDPLDEIARICRKHRVFLHVDAAFSGSAAILPEKRPYLDGVEQADTFVFNPHKWLYTNFDCSAFYVKDVALLTRTCGIQPAYLQTRHDEDVVNFRDWGLPLGRRFRALKLWFVIRMLGVDGIRQRLRRAIGLAERLAARVEEHEDFELLAPPTVTLVCFRYRPAGASEPDLDLLNRRLLEAVNDTGQAYLTHTMLAGRYSLRLNTSQERTTEDDVLESWRLIERCARRL